MPGLLTAFCNPACRRVPPNTTVTNAKPIWCTMLHLVGCSVSTGAPVCSSRDYVCCAAAAAGAVRPALTLALTSYPSTQCMLAGQRRSCMPVSSAAHLWSGALSHDQTHSPHCLVVLAVPQPPRCLDYLGGQAHTADSCIQLDVVSCKSFQYCQARSKRTHMQQSPHRPGNMCLILFPSLRAPSVCCHRGVLHHAVRGSRRRVQARA
jgi:hypothetical protein